MEILNNLVKLSSYLSVPYLKVVKFCSRSLASHNSYQTVMTSVKSAGDWCSTVLCYIYIFLLENKRIIWQFYLKISHTTLEVVLKTAMPGSVRIICKAGYLSFFLSNRVLLAKSVLEFLSSSDSSSQASQVAWDYRCHDHTQLSNTHFKNISQFTKQYVSSMYKISLVI